VKERPDQSLNKNGAAGKQKTQEDTEVLSLAKIKKPRARANQSKAGKGQAKEKETAADVKVITGQKRKNQQVYLVKTPALLLTGVENPLAMVVHQGGGATPVNGEIVVEESMSNDSNKKRKRR
jgi:hypothetical protein